MTDCYSIEPPVDGITIVTMWRSPSLSEAIDILNELAQRDSYHRRLFDFGDREFTMSHSDLLSMVEYSKNLFTAPNVMACVASMDASYGMLRVVAAYREQANMSLPKVFRTRQEAWDWLLSYSMED